MACLWSRTANRVLLEIDRFPCRTREDLYRHVFAIPWTDHFSLQRTFAVRCTLHGSAMSHSKYAALVVKDAIADYFRRKTGKRPSVNVDLPDVLLNVNIRKDIASMAIDFSGLSLHQRGYRGVAVPAPIKENVAAAILLRAKWPSIARDGGAFVDPMCGSGTFAIEAAMMATGTASGLFRHHYGFLGWKLHDPKLWKNLLNDAKSISREGREHCPPIASFDSDGAAVDAARSNIESAGFRDQMSISKKSLSALHNPFAGSVSTGLVAVNPPYGERIAGDEELAELYRTLGARLKEHYKGWAAAVLTSQEQLAWEIGLRAHQKHAFMNGPITCNLYHFHVYG
ncbi:23S rRNA (guanine(2445)-N(2))/(guanine(2069)-N(7))-methyltransferase, partial [bacterium]|nr:23S rRNA (guanine(2445)-N(2))/(guanine(2069)-N(7))-methyltransferase [candidate division CSSED10-310 bacterium]